MDIFKEYDVDSGLVNLGGNVRTYRTKTDGSKWRVAVQSPEDESHYIGVVDVSDRRLSPPVDMSVILSRMEKSTTIS